MPKVILFYNILSKQKSKVKWKFVLNSYIIVSQKLNVLIRQIIFYAVDNITL